MKKFMKGIIATGCVVLLFVIAMMLTGGETDYRVKYEDTDLTAEVMGIGRSDTYERYLESHADVPPGEAAFQLDLDAFQGDGLMQDEGLYTTENGTITFPFSVEQDGMYFIQLDYLTVESRGVDMERALYINESLPFSGAGTLQFNRIWTDDGEVRKDNQGNDIRPSQTEYFASQKAFCKDSMGYTPSPYQFFIPAGNNTLSLKAINEPMILQGITLLPAREYASYEEYASKLPQVQMSEEAQHWLLKVQGETARFRSSPSLYARYDHSSPATEPYSVTNTILNYIGGDSWNMAGQWIEWEIEVPEDGYYNLSVKARQAYQRGSLSCRMLYLDGEIPFQEATDIAFAYDTAWKMHTLSDQAGKPFRFFMTKGTHVVRLEVTLGQMGAILSDMENSIYRLNQIYRKILVLTGVNPDRFRDYNIKMHYPEVIQAMELEYKRLYKLVDDTVAVAGQKSDRIAVAQTLAVQLEQFVEDNDRITQSFTNFKDNITSLGTAMLNMSESKLDIDYIVVSGEQAQLPEIRDGFLQKAGHELSAMGASFVVDYDALGNKYVAENGDENGVLDVWILTGRDQSTILKTMIDDTFTPSTGIPVNVKLVAEGTLLTAVVAGNGPDVVLSLGNGNPVNYAMRNAVEDLTQFSDYEEVVKPFYDSAITPLRYNGGVYGLPETQIFSLLFYRKDIMEEMGFTPPQTWDELIAMLPTIQGNNMSIGVPFPTITTADMSALISLIFQNGGAIYDEEGKRTLIDREEGVRAFELYTSLYNDYSLPTDYDFVNRFRSGEMPIGLAGYTVYNTLVVSAPEIRGLWDFTLYPGTLRTGEDGTSYIDRSVSTSGTCCMMIGTDNQKIKEMGWEFMKWWVSEDTQVRFGREIESVLGSSARYSTANTKALKKLAWSSSQLQVLEEQMAQTVGFPEIAGGYSTTRHMTNAVRKVINEKKDPRETLIKYVRTINEEITFKRQEFDLPVD